MENTEQEVKLLSKDALVKQIKVSQEAIQQMQGSIHQHLGAIQLCNNLLQQYKWEDDKKVD
jgi:hypothetical protein